MINNILRNGNFTSSEIVALTKVGKSGAYFGEKALTYIAQKNFERKLGRCLNSEKNAKPLSWGKHLEAIIFDLIGTEYKFSSDQTFAHPNFSYWVGSPDGMKFDEGGTVFDFKSPLTLESFCTLVDPLYNGKDGMDAMNWIRENHTDGEKFYWQLVSNSIIMQTQFCELIVFMPYEKELETVKLYAVQSGDSRVKWIAFAEDNELPFLPEGGYYKNVNIIRFEPPLKDKLYLAERVKAAALRLIDPSNPHKSVEEKLLEQSLATIPVDPSKLLKKIS